MSTDPSPFSRAAVLLMDYQPAILSLVQDQSEQLIARASTVLAAARAAGVPVIYVRVAFRPGHPEVSERNLLFTSVKEAGWLVMDNAASDIDTRLTPQPGEVLITKRRVGIFYGTDLEPVLRAKDVDTLILLGVSTSGVVLSTVRHAADADYRLYVVNDCCADPHSETHEFLMEQVFPSQATVLTSVDFVGRLGQS